MSPRLRIGLLAACAIGLATAAGLRLADRVDGDAAEKDRTEADDLNQIMFASEEAARRQDYETAVEGFLSIPTGGDPRSVAAQLKAGDLLLNQLRQPTRGFAVLNELLVHFPEQIDARTLLAQYFDAVGREFESDQQSREVVGLGDTRLLHVLCLARDRAGVGDPKLLHKMEQSSPEDPNVQLGTALLEISAGNHVSAEQTLRSVIERAPRLWTAQAALATTLTAQGKQDDINAWQSALPADADSSSEVWLARGHAAVERQQPEVAARCFVEAVRIDPDHLDANRQAAHWLAKIGRAEDAAPFEERAAQLAELAELVRIDPEMRDAAHLDRAAQLTEQMGRLWEARNWTYNLARTNQYNPEFQSRLKRFVKLLVPETIEQSRNDANPANRIAVSDLPDR